MFSGRTDWVVDRLCGVLDTRICGSLTLSHLARIQMNVYIPDFASACVHDYQSFELSTCLGMFPRKLMFDL